MKRYALVESGVVSNVMLWDGDTEKWAPPEGVLAVEIPEGLPVTTGTGFKDGEFSVDPTEPIYVPEPSPEDRLRANTEARNALLHVAGLAIAPLQDALDLESATATEAGMLKKWKQYRIDVNRIDLAETSPKWPKAPV